MIPENGGGALEFTDTVGPYRPLYCTTHRAFVWECRGFHEADNPPNTRPLQWDSKTHKWVEWRGEEAA